MYVVLAAGGSGGHTIPAKRLAHQLQERGAYTAFFATKGFGTKWRALSIDPLKALFSFIKKRPHLVIGFGSYHSLPALIAATLLRIPIVLVELNAIPGKVNRLFARHARFTAGTIPFDGAIHATLPMPKKQGQKRERLLIMGGSHGARSLNEAVKDITLPDMPITHLTGKSGGGIDHPQADVKPFEENMAPLWESTDIAITRAGGMTIAELLYYRVPAILVPFPHAADDHQKHNADYLISRGMALPFSGNLQADLTELLNRKEEIRAAMNEANAPLLTDLIMKELIPATHFLGIGGCGMSALAHILLDRGARVFGTDATYSPTVQALEERGARITKEHNAKRIVRSTAIRDDHPELDRTLPIIHRSQLLAEQMIGKKGLLVAGTHGKTSTSALLAWTLKTAGLEPSYAIGGTAPTLMRNGKYDAGEYFVAEADESDGSFLNLKPHHAIITNIEAEHLDYWGSEENMRRGFERFIASVQGTLFWCSEDPILSTMHPPGVSYSIEEWPQFVGRHNKLNASAVAALSRHIGICDQTIAEAFATFKGVKRRSEFIGAHHGISIYDDYAHHPTEIIATLSAFREGHAGRLIAVFQPHRYTRTRDHLDAFSHAFTHADEVIITDIYAAGEKPLEGMHALVLLQMLHGKRAHYIPRDELTRFLANFVQDRDIVLTLGAGDITNVGGELLANL